jgi:hypothetical protein
MIKNGNWYPDDLHDKVVRYKILSLVLSINITRIIECFKIEKKSGKARYSIKN